MVDPRTSNEYENDDADHDTEEKTDDYKHDDDYTVEDGKWRRPRWW